MDVFIILELRGARRCVPCSELGWVPVVVDTVLGCQSPSCCTHIPCLQGRAEAESAFAKRLSKLEGSSGKQRPADGLLESGWQAMLKFTEVCVCQEPSVPAPARCVVDHQLFVRRQRLLY